MRMIGIMNFIYFYSISNKSFDVMFLPREILKIKENPKSRISTKRPKMFSGNFCPDCKAV